jgi:hypothetical protein
MWRGAVCPLIDDQMMNEVLSSPKVIKWSPSISHSMASQHNIIYLAVVVQWG